MNKQISVLKFLGPKNIYITKALYDLCTSEVEFTFVSCEIDIFLNI